ncbi:MAG TPA: HEAT repeat domain-containing protein [Gemmatales bacterium]|nr:HEAT repeat domain-containing protein [Gemmatales bacterium]
MRIILFLAVALSGCGQSVPVPSDLVFSGQNVQHWVTLAKSKQVKERKHAIGVLSNVGTAHPDAIPALIVALRDTDVTIRLAAVQGLSKIGPPANSALSALEISAKDSDKRVADQSKGAIKRIKGET